jgi:hypothetical protein
MHVCAMRARTCLCLCVAQVNLNALALDARGEWLYFSALTGETVYRVRTRVYSVGCGAVACV